MAEEIRFNELANVGELSPSAIVAIVQEQQGELVSLQCSVAQIADLIVNGIQFQALTSEDKKIIGAINEVMAKVDDLELFKFPNVTIIGTPTINHGQISNFSATDFLKFPFLVDFKNQAFDINMAFTTGENVTSQENIFDSDYGLAFAIRNGRFVIAISTNGTTWDLGEGVGTYAVQPNTTYYVRLSWDGSNYKLAYSLDGTSYTDDIIKAGSAQPFPRQIYIGVGENFAAVVNHFTGTINLNKADLRIAGEVVWLGMDDAGLSTRADTSLSNIDAAGEQRIKDIAGGGEVTKAYVDQQDAILQEQISENKADLTDTNRSLDALWKLNEGQTYEIESKVETGMSINPSGTFSKSVLDIRGDSKQNTTNGLNLFNNKFSRGTLSAADGSFTPAQTLKSVCSTDFIKVTLPFSYYIPIISTSGKGRAYDINMQYLGTILMDFATVGEHTIVNAPNNTEYIKFELDLNTEEDTQAYLNESVTFYLSSGNSVSYEPYTGGIPSPNPQYPQEIKSVEELNFKKMGKNLAKFDSRLFLDVAGSNKLVLGSNNVRTAIIKVKKGSTYYLSGDTSLLNANVYRFAFTTIYPEIGTPYTRVTTNIAGGMQSFANDGYFLVMLPFVKGIDTDGFQFELGTVPTEYEPYHEELKTIIPPFALNKSGDIFDKADIDSGKWIKVIKTITEADYIHSIASDTDYFVLSEPIEQDISTSDLEYLKSLINLDKNTTINITDQDGNDISYLMEYIIKLSEVN